MKKIKANNVGTVFVILLALIMVLIAIPYLSLNPEYGLLADKPLDVKSSSLWQITFYTHVVGGIIAILIGPFQFFRNFRNKSLSRHRLLGKIYVFTILLASPLAFYTALLANGGIIARAGFVGLALAWFITTFMAYRKVRQGNIELHKQWMVRSYAVTFAAATFRFWIPIELALGFSFETLFIINTWLCWVPNLFVAEYLIRKQVVLT